MARRYLVLSIPLAITHIFLVGCPPACWSQSVAQLRQLGGHRRHMRLISLASAIVPRAPADQRRAVAPGAAGLARRREGARHHRVIGAVDEQDVAARTGIAGQQQAVAAGAILLAAEAQHGPGERGERRILCIRAYCDAVRGRCHRAEAVGTSLIVSINISEGVSGNEPALVYSIIPGSHIEKTRLYIHAP